MRFIQVSSRLAVNFEQVAWIDFVSNGVNIYFHPTSDDLYVRITPEEYRLIEPLLKIESPPEPTERDEEWQ